MALGVVYWTFTFKGGYYLFKDRDNNQSQTIPMKLQPKVFCTKNKELRS